MFVLSRLKHPNLVELIGVVTNGLPVMIISEFMSKVGTIQTMIISCDESLVGLSTRLLTVARPLRYHARSANQILSRH
jgi:hypothetical protein